MAASSPSAAIEFRTDRVERLMLGGLLVLVGGGALAFWNVERSLQWPLVMIALIGALFVGLGLFLIGFRRVVRLERERGVTERHTLFGMAVGQRVYPLVDFEAVGSHGATTEMLSLDVVLFRSGGGHLTLRRMLSDAEAKHEIARVARCLDLPAEYQPRTRVYAIGR